MRRQRVVSVSFTVAITATFLLLGVFVFGVSYKRLYEAIIDLYGGFLYYIRVLFGIKTNRLPSVTDYSKIIDSVTILPSDVEGFKSNATAYLRLLISKENFLSWFGATGQKASVPAKVLTILLPCVLMLIIAVKRLYAKGNNNYNVDTLPLRAFKKISAVTYQPIKRFVCGYIEFLQAHNWVWISWLVMWTFHLNLASIVIAFFAYYFYFAVSFDFIGIYTQIVKLVRDLQPFFKFFRGGDLSL